MIILIMVVMMKTMLVTARMVAMMILSDTKVIAFGPFEIDQI